MSPAANNKLAQISKLSFRAYSADTFESSKYLNKEFIVQFNPKSLGVDYTITYQEGSGNNAKVEFVKAKPSDLTIEFTLDGTGIDTMNENSVTDVKQRISEFLEMCKETNPETHEPPFIMVTYGSLIYKTRFKGCNITYTLFRADGTPLRAVLKATFLNIKNNVTDERQVSLNSPDVTHRRNLAAQESVIQKAYEIYQRNDLYIEVARANKLDSFRKGAMQKNQTIYFPPIKK